MDCGFEATVAVPFDLKFELPCDCTPDGKVRCQVEKAQCEIWDRCRDLVTLCVRFRLVIKIWDGDDWSVICRDLVLKESVWLDPCAEIDWCEVRAVVCQCRICCGLLWCRGSLEVAVHVRHRVPVWTPCRLPPRPLHRHIRPDHPCHRCRPDPCHFEPCCIE